jgi:hypothetical protein
LFAVGIEQSVVMVDKSFGNVVDVGHCVCVGVLNEQN